MDIGKGEGQTESHSPHPSPLPTPTSPSQHTGALRSYEAFLHTMSQNQTLPLVILVLPAFLIPLNQPSHNPSNPCIHSQVFAQAVSCIRNAVHPPLCKTDPPPQETTKYNTPSTHRAGITSQSQSIMHSSLWVFSFEFMSFSMHHMVKHYQPPKRQKKSKNNFKSFLALVMTALILSFYRLTLFLLNYKIYSSVWFLRL